MPNQRHYQPTLLWALFQEWAREQQARSHHPSPYPFRLSFYRTDRAGAYLMIGGPRLFWDDDVEDEYFSNCDQDELWVHRDAIGEVVAEQRGSPGVMYLLGRTIDEAVERLTTRKAA